MSPIRVPRFLTSIALLGIAATLGYEHGRHHRSQDAAGDHRTETTASQPATTTIPTGNGDGPSPRIVDTVVVDYAAVGSVAARWAS